MARILTKLRIDEVSSVDRGAGEGVRVVLMKRHDDMPHRETLRQIFGCACRKSNPGILVVQSTQDRTAKNVSSALNGARSGKGGFGDALIEVEIKPDRSFTRQGDDIYLELPITLTEAVLGARIRVPAPTGAVTMAVPKGTNTGTTLRLRGKGAPKHDGGYGDQLVKLKVVLPKEPDPELEAFVSNWGGGKTYKPREEVTP